MKTSLRPRKTPSQRRSADTVACIIEAAAQILESAGLEGFSTNAVAERAGISIGSLYQYYPGKDALIVALTQRERERFYAEVLTSSAVPNGEAALDSLISAAIRQQLQRPVLARLLDVEERRLHLEDEDPRPETFERLLRSILVRTVPGLKRPNIAAHDVMAMIQGIVDASGERGESDSVDLERRVRAAVFGYLSCMNGDENARQMRADLPFSRTSRTKKRELS